MFDCCVNFREWKEGLLSSLLRKFCTQQANENFEFNSQPIMKIVQLDGEVIGNICYVLSKDLANSFHVLGYFSDLVFKLLFSPERPIVVLIVLDYIAQFHIYFS